MLIEPYKVREVALVDTNTSGADTSGADTSGADTSGPKTQWNCVTILQWYKPV